MIILTAYCDDDYCGYYYDGCCDADYGGVVDNAENGYYARGKDFRH